MVSLVPCRSRGANRLHTPAFRDSISCPAWLASGFVTLAWSTHFLQGASWINTPDQHLPQSLSHLGSRIPLPHYSITFWSRERTTLHSGFLFFPCGSFQVPPWNCSVPSPLQSLNLSITPSNGADQGSAASGCSPVMGPPRSFPFLHAERYFSLFPTMF